MRRGQFERRHVPRFEKYLRARQAREAEGFEPVRCCCSCHLVGWLKHKGAQRIEAIEFQKVDRLYLTYRRVTFGVLETGEEDIDRRSEHAWQSNDYTLDELGKFPTFEQPTEDERLLDPAPSWLLASYLDANA